jgi:isocitrate lyase
MKNQQPSYVSAVEAVQKLKEKYGDTWREINPEHAARMFVQNRFKTGLDIAKYTAAIMREDMAAYDADQSKYTQSLGAWHGFVAQQNTQYLPARVYLLKEWDCVAVHQHFKEVQNEGEAEDRAPSHARTFPPQPRFVAGMAGG